MWRDDTRFHIDGVEFACSFGKSSAERFCIRKPRPLVEATVELVRQRVSPRIVELGIAEGGSTALLALAGRPSKLVAFEVAPEPVEALAALIVRRQLDAVVRAHYGVDQSDRSKIAALLAAELGSEPLDLVVDDASHRLEPTRVSFETIFPRLRPGGRYVIEDWCWQLQMRHLLARGEPGVAPPAGGGPLLVEAGAEGRADFEAYARANAGRPLETLALELVLARACSGGAVAGVHVDEHWIVVERGPAALDAAAFRLSDWYQGAAGLIER
jgi:hypothetical protein